MKKLLCPCLLALVAAYPLAGFGQNGIEKDPAYLPIEKVLDLNAIRPQVNVNLPRFLLKDALSGFSGADTNSPAGELSGIADLIKDVKLIRVVVIEANKTERAALEKGVKALRAELEKHWTAIFSVPQENVGVYAMSDPAGESTSGLAVLIYDGGDAVIGNIVGHVSIGKLIKIASQSNMVPKDVLKKLEAVANVTNGPKTKSSEGAGTNAPTTAPKPAAGDAPTK